MRRRWAITAPDSQEVVLVLGSSVDCKNKPKLLTNTEHWKARGRVKASIGREVIYPGQALGRSR